MAIQVQKRDDDLYKFMKSWEVAYDANPDKKGIFHRLFKGRSIEPNSFSNCYLDAEAYYNKCDKILREKVLPLEKSKIDTRILNLNRSTTEDNSFSHDTAYYQKNIVIKKFYEISKVLSESNCVINCANLKNIEELIRKKVNDEEKVNISKVDVESYLEPELKIIKSVAKKEKSEYNGLIDDLKDKISQICGYSAKSTKLSDLLNMLNYHFNSINKNMEFVENILIDCKKRKIPLSVENVRILFNKNAPDSFNKFYNFVSASLEKDYGPVAKYDLSEIKSILEQIKSDTNIIHAISGKSKPSSDDIKMHYIDTNGHSFLYNFLYNKLDEIEKTISKLKNSDDKSKYYILREKVIVQAQKIVDNTELWSSLKYDGVPSTKKSVKPIKDRFKSFFKK